MSPSTFYLRYITPTTGYINKINLSKFTHFNPLRLIPSTVLKTYICKPASNAYLIKTASILLVILKHFFMFFILFLLLSIIIYGFFKLEKLFLKIEAETKDEKEMDIIVARLKAFELGNEKSTPKARKGQSYLVIPKIVINQPPSPPPPKIAIHPPPHFIFNRRQIIKDGKLTHQVMNQHK